MWLHARFRALEKVPKDAKKKLFFTSTQEKKRLTDFT